MQELFRILKERSEENKASMLVTVVDGSGSIPRKAGAYMIVGDEGRIYGTIGGGNMEYQAILKVRVSFRRSTIICRNIFLHRIKWRILV